MFKLIKLSLSRTNEALFRPFATQKWLWLTFIAFLAGGLGAGGSGIKGVGRLADILKGATDRARVLSTAEGARAGAVGGAGAASGVGATKAVAGGEAEKKSSPVTPDSLLDRFQRGGRRLGHYGRLHKPWVAAIGLMLVLIFLLFLWLGARFQFVWLNAVMKNTAEIAGPFDDYAPQGNSLFRFILTILGVWLLLLAGVGRWAFLAAKAVKMFEPETARPAGELVGVFLPILAVFVVGSLLMGLLAFCVRQFVTPMMAMGETGFYPAFKTWGGIAIRRKGAFLLYFVTWLLLKLAAYLFITILGFMLLLAFVACGAILFGSAYLVLVSMLKLKVLFAAVAVVIGIPFLLLMIGISLTMRLPFAFFFQSFALYFLSSLECGYELLPLPGEDHGES